MRTGYRGKNVLELASQLLKKYPNEKLFNLSYKQLSSLKGIGKAKASTILSAKELFHRIYRSNKISVPIIKTPYDAIAQVNEIRTRKKENFVALYLNARNEVLHKEFISIGILDTSIVHPREVFAPAIENRAAGIILLHNHPSNDLEPSDNDKKITSKLKEGGEILGIEIIDHIIITSDSYLSFKEQNLL